MTNRTIKSLLEFITDDSINSDIKSKQVKYYAAGKKLYNEEHIGLLECVTNYFDAKDLVE